MTERGLPIVDGAPACPFVAFEDDRDERASSPDHRHRCYAETQPAPRALAHQEAYCLSSAFPVCPTFQDWARREAARARADAGRSAPTRDLPTDADAAAAAAAGAGLSASQRNPPRNWAAPPPWVSRKGGNQAASEQLWAEDGDFDEADPDAPIVAQVPRRGRGLSGSYADRVATDSDPNGPPLEGDEDLVDADEPRRADPPSRGEVPAPAYRGESWQESPNPDDVVQRRFRHRERDMAGPAVAGGAAAGAGAAAAGGSGPVRERQSRGPAPEWERAKPMEAYPTLRSRRLPELAIPPILVAVVAIALAAAVLFALPGLLGFGNPSANGSPSPSTPAATPLPSLPATPLPQATPVVYVVQAGDTLSRIAGRFGITLADLIAANTETLPDPDKLQIGDRLVIPAPQPSELPAAT
jgi:nucleoid-associated protein YgaU